MIEDPGRRLIDQVEVVGARTVMKASQGPEEKSKHPPLAEACGVSPRGRFNQPGRYDWCMEQWPRGHMRHHPLLQTREAFHSSNRSEVPEVKQNTQGTNLEGGKRFGLEVDQEPHARITSQCDSASCNRLWGAFTRGTVICRATTA
jgi:hypothetical protein